MSKWICKILSSSQRFCMDFPRCKIVWCQQWYCAIYRCGKLRGRSFKFGRAYSGLDKNKITPFKFWFCRKLSKFGLCILDWSLFLGLGFRFRLEISFSAWDFVFGLSFLLRLEISLSAWDFVFGLRFRMWHELCNVTVAVSNYRTSMISFKPTLQTALPQPPVPHLLQVPLVTPRTATDGIKEGSHVFPLSLVYRCAAEFKCKPHLLLWLEIPHLI